MANKHQNAKTWAIAGLLERINRGENPRLLGEEARKLLENVSPEDIAAAEQNLVEDGCPARVAHQLSAALVFVGLHESIAKSSEEKLPNNHIIRRVMIEHDLFRSFLADLHNIIEEIVSLESLTDVSSEFRRLVRIVRQLNAIKEHIEREEDVIFPYLRQHCWTEMTQTSHDEHIEIITHIDNLIGLVISFNNIQYRDFEIELIKTVGRLSAIIPDHFSGEDDFLWPISLATIDRPGVWERIKGLCDEIGYCGVHL
jgi:DUF438 domain-containing protein